ncbi:helix-turn-helix domain-containing protein [Myxococcus sp. Y35]|uniref:helix-turn-helix domain-containing protein n=1 Tax=Pseudomyxococcus flavus TaxID=3115648 RepID=UPI003CF4352C
MVRRVIREEIASAPGRDVDMLTLVEAAAVARVSGSVIQAWLRSGQLTRYGTVRRILVSRRQLMEVLRHQPPALPNDAELPDDAIEAQAALYARGG